jgi:glycosyltransferase involved in cell wall biosynthesis
MSNSNEATKTPAIAVVIPALNEADNLTQVIRDLPDGLRVLVVDNGSTDETAAVARAAGALVYLEPKRGYGNAVLRGIEALSTAPPEILVILDADHSDHPELLPRLTQPIEADIADMVLANRTQSAEPGALTPPQRFGNWLATRLISLSTGVSYADMGPFRAIRWSALRALNMSDPTWGWNVEMQMKAAHHNLRILEVSLPYRCRRAGESKISGNMSGAIRAGTRILWAVGRYHRP